MVTWALLGIWACLRILDYGIVHVRLTGSSEPTQGDVEELP